MRHELQNFQRKMGLSQQLIRSTANLQDNAGYHGFYPQCWDMLIVPGELYGLRSVFNPPWLQGTHAQLVLKVFVLVVPDPEPPKKTQKEGASNTTFQRLPRRLWQS